MKKLILLIISLALFGQAALDLKAQEPINCNSCIAPAIVEPCCPPKPCRPPRICRKPIVCKPRWTCCKVTYCRPKKICCPKYRCCRPVRCCPVPKPECPDLPCVAQTCYSGGYYEPVYPEEIPANMLIKDNLSDGNLLDE